MFGHIFVLMGGGFPDGEAVAGFVDAAWSRGRVCTAPHVGCAWMSRAGAWLSNGRPV